MLREMKRNFLWCYYDDKARFFEEVFGCVGVMGAALLLTYTALALWG